jgi:hypothetical protein
MPSYARHYAVDHDPSWLHGRPVLVISYPRDGYVRVMRLDRPVIVDGHRGYRLETVRRSETVERPWSSIVDVVAGITMVR